MSSPPDAPRGHCLSSLLAPNAPIKRLPSAKRLQINDFLAVPKEPHPKQKLHQYVGPLTPQQASEGMNAAEQNAHRLLADAQRLLEAGSFATSASLSILAIEESGKVSILRAILLSRSQAETKDNWRAYRSHTKKNAAWLLPTLVSSGARQLEDLRPLFHSDADHPHLLDNLKQLGFYTDCLGACHWSQPSAVIDEALAKALLAIGRLFVRDKVHSVRELELWREHIGPVWKGDLSWMKTAVASWYAAMGAEGLTSETQEEVHRFIWGASGPTPPPNA